ncbi:hypothetical protein M0811_00818 [Anaeramoeba ignava]|uniref:Uncharacterized protein n=1 Tax=Anaeramoeba ignava TaxID=1746090 RepID=A0A9Q0RCZ2_ANAIG|nr:hypothetical protein M0811_00818 [Anaeramoeba ignava]
MDDLRYEIGDSSQETQELDIQALEKKAKQVISGWKQNKPNQDLKAISTKQKEFEKNVKIINHEIEKMANELENAEEHQIHLHELQIIQKFHKQYMDEIKKFKQIRDQKIKLAKDWYSTHLSTLDKILEQEVSDAQSIFMKQSQSLQDKLVFQARESRKLLRLPREQTKITENSKRKIEEPFENFNFFENKRQNKTDDLETIEKLLKIPTNEPNKFEVHDQYLYYEKAKYEIGEYINLIQDSGKTFYGKLIKITPKIIQLQFEDQSTKEFKIQNLNSDKYKLSGV